MIARINSLKHINTIRAILRFKYLDIFTTFLFLKLSTKNDDLPFPFDDDDCALSKYKPIALLASQLNLPNRTSFYTQN